MRLILLRHGETDWNALDRYQGHTDIELNAEGERQARRAAGGPVGDLIEDAEELVAVCSPLARARRTAEIVLEARVGAAPVAVDPELMELAGGEWEGLELSAIAERWPDELAVPGAVVRAALLLVEANFEPNTPEVAELLRGIAQKLLLPYRLNTGIGSA